MTEPDQDEGWAFGRICQELFGRPLPLEAETTRFILVSTLDIFMTYLSLSYRDEANNPVFIESNPIARFFINHWGVKGMYYFKLTMVAVATVIAQVVARKKLETARMLLNGASVVVAGVVVYSLVLFLRTVAR